MTAAATCTTFHMLPGAFALIEASTNTLTSTEQHPEAINTKRKLSSAPFYHFLFTSLLLIAAVFLLLHKERLSIFMIVIPPPQPTFNTDNVHHLKCAVMIPSWIIHTIFNRGMEKSFFHRFARTYHGSAVTCDSPHTSRQLGAQIFVHLLSALQDSARCFNQSAGPVQPPGRPEAQDTD